MKMDTHSRRHFLSCGLALAGLAALPVKAEPLARRITQQIELIPPAPVWPYKVNNPAQWHWITPGSTNSVTWLHLHAAPRIVSATLHVIGHAWHSAYGLGVKLVIQDRSGQFWHDIGDPVWLQPGWMQNREDFTEALEAERLYQIEDEAATDPLTDPQQGLGNPLGAQVFGVGHLTRARLTVGYEI